jgi:hypothetical protein
MGVWNGARRFSRLGDEESALPAERRIRLVVVETLFPARRRHGGGFTSGNGGNFIRLSGLDLVAVFTGSNTTRRWGPALSDRQTPASGGSLDLDHIRKRL